MDTCAYVGCAPGYGLNGSQSEPPERVCNTPGSNVSYSGENRVCVPCVDGTFQSELNGFFCTAVSECSSLASVIQEATSSSDRQCVAAAAQQDENESVDWVVPTTVGGCVGLVVLLLCVKIRQKKRTNDAAVDVAQALSERRVPRTK